MKLHWQIAIALGAAVVAGTLWGDVPWFIQACSFVGELFINALKMIIIPLILGAIVSGMAALAGGGKLGRMGLHTMLFYMGSGLAAILVGLFWVDVLQPGVVDGKPAGAMLGLSADAQKVAASMESKGWGELAKVVQMMLPPNIIAAAAEGQMLGIVCFALLFGYFAARLSPDTGPTQHRFWRGVYEVMVAITGLVMRFAPIGVFGLVTRVVAQTGLDAVMPLATFFLAVILGLLTHALVTLPLVLRLVARVSPVRHFQAMAPALLTAFSTSSSAATLPVTLDCIEKRAGVPPRVSGFVLPVGANINTDGSALYECVAAMFIAQAYGVNLDFATQFLVVVIALLTSLGVAGIPAASLIAIVIILGAVGVPAEGIGLILAVDRVLDMSRTTVNVLGDSVATVTVARLAGEDIPGLTGSKNSLSDA